MDFLDRERELEALRSFRGIAIVYGRRRIGKTELARRALPHALYINGFVDTLEGIARKLGVEPSRTAVLLKAKEVIVDEFQFFGEAFARNIAYAYDLLKDEIRLVLVTSYFSRAKLIASSSSPLYGRISRRILLKQLPRKDVVKRYGLEAYLLFGGTPQYLKRGLEYGFECFYDDTCALSKEAEDVLSYEFRSPRYAEVLKSTYQRPRPIEDKGLQYYANILVELDVMRKYSWGKTNLWEISDNYFRTRYITRHVSSKEEAKRIALDENFEALFRNPEVRSPLGALRVTYPYGLSVEIDALVELEDRFLAVEVKRRRAKEEDCRKLIRKISALAKALRRSKKPVEPAIVALEGRTSCETFVLDDFL